MPIITLHTIIHSDIETCFDLSRSIDLHKLSTAKTKETAIEGVTSGLIGLGELVTWRATHFGIRQNLTSKISEYDRPFYFRDEQVKGPFKLLIHDHHFQQNDDHILMTDRFNFESPWGIAGKFFNLLVLTKYMRKFLSTRNEIIKVYAETMELKEKFI